MPIVAPYSSRHWCCIVYRAVERTATSYWWACISRRATHKWLCSCNDEGRGYLSCRQTSFYYPDETRHSNLAYRLLIDVSSLYMRQIVKWDFKGKCSVRLHLHVRLAVPKGSLLDPSNYAVDQEYTSQDMSTSRKEIRYSPAWLFEPKCRSFGDFEFVLGGEQIVFEGERSIQRGLTAED